MNDTRYESLASLLLGLEQVMRTAGIWDCTQPADGAFNSSQPFCVDTMDFEQWVKYVFITRLQMLINEGAALPTNCDVSPMAEEAWKSEDCQPVIEVIKRIDELLTKQTQ